MAFPKPFKFIPQNPKKYAGNSEGIIGRSHMEYRVMKWLDRNVNVISWASEELIIPYVSPADGKVHRYFPDFVAKMRRDDGSVGTVILEVKPFSQTIQPKQRTKSTRKYLSECMLYEVNQAKWDATKAFCAKNNWKFELITENDLKVE